MTPALIAYIAAQIADVLTTVRALRRGHGEANPVLRWFLRRFGRYSWAVVKVFFIATIASYLWQRDAEVELLIVAGVTGLVAINNWRVVS